MSRTSSTPIASHRFGHFGRGLTFGLTASAVVVIVAAALAGLLALRGSAGPASGQTHIYWANHLTGTIGRANLDGTDVNQRFIVEHPGMCGLAIVGDYVYWANDEENVIGRTRLDGTGPNQILITDTAGGCGLASDGTYLYWTNRHGGESGSLGRARLDGSEANQTFVAEIMPPSFVGIAIDQGAIYWGSAVDAIGCVAISGKYENDYCASISTSVTGLVAAQGHLYWGNRQGTTIGRGTIVPGEPRASIADADEAFLDVGGNPEGLASDGTYLYWSAAGRIGRANLDGTGLNGSFITGASVPTGVAVG